MRNPLVQILIACLGYYIAGRLGLLLAIPPGFASAVWPASGVALVSVLLMQRLPALVGIGVGSFLINLGVATGNFSNISFDAIVLAALISIGAISQAFVGWFLWNKLLPEHALLDTPKQVYRFVLLVAPVGCLIAASVGSGTLVSVGFVASENFIFTWLTWWVGDTIGVLLFTPLLFICLFDKNNLWKQRKVQIAVPTVCIFLGVLLLFVLSTRARHDAIEQEIVNTSERYFDEVEERFILAKEKLLAFNSLYKAFGSVNREQFSRFAQSQLKAHAVMSSVGWTQIIPHSERDNIEMEIRKLGYSSFSFMEFDFVGSTRILKKAQVREVYYPVLNIVPMAGNEAAFGLDLGANPDRLQALQAAFNTETAVSTAPILLAQEKDNRRSLIVYLPIFDVAGYGAMKTFKGYVGAVYGINEIIGPMLDDATNENFNIEIVDITDSASPQVLLEPSLENLAEYEAVRFELEFCGRLFEVSFAANSDFIMSGKDWTSWTVLTIGFLLASLLQALLLTVTGTTEQIRNKVLRKTEDLRRATRLAEAANDAKSEFLANMSHEFRTPLNAIIGFTTLCLRSDLTDKQRNFLEKVVLSSDTLLHIINDTLDYSKIEAGKVNIEHIEFDFPELIQKIYSIYYRQCEAKGIRFISELNGMIPKTLIGDPVRIEQVITNLCSNAVKFTEKGTVIIDFDIEYLSGEQINLQIRVTDTGIGISEEQQEALFKSFQQADNSTTRKYGGTGLGLAISRQLTELMGGKISLNSRPKVGTTFTLYIPMSIKLGSHKISAEELSLMLTDSVG